MDRFSFYRVFMGCYLFGNVIATVLLAWFLIRKNQVNRPLNRVAVFLSTFVLIESANFVWLAHFADDLFSIRDQGIEISRWQLFYFGPVFLAALLLSIFATERRKLCVFLCLGYILFGAVAIFTS